MSAIAYNRRTQNTQNDRGDGIYAPDSGVMLSKQKERTMNTLIKTPLFLACITTLNLAWSIAVPARGDVVTDWNNAALDAIRAGNTAPPIASRSLAILHVAIYDAVNGIARTHENYLV